MRKKAKELAELTRQFLFCLSRCQPVQHHHRAPRYPSRRRHQDHLLRKRAYLCAVCLASFLPLSSQLTILALINPFPLQTLRFVQSLPKRERTPLSSHFPKAAPLAVDILEKMLVFDPKTRISAAEALLHPFLEPYHDPSDEPVAEEQFDWSFNDADLPVDTWKVMMYRFGLFLFPLGPSTPFPNTAISRRFLLPNPSLPFLLPFPLPPTPAKSLTSINSLATPSTPILQTSSCNLNLRTVSSRSFRSTSLPPHLPSCRQPFPSSFFTLSS
jgi:serine/threonine protein kinase